MKPIIPKDRSLHSIIRERYNNTSKSTHPVNASKDPDCSGHNQNTTYKIVTEKNVGMTSQTKSESIVT
jgi:hypothetical protein